ncbi:TPA: hypothetical protein I7730_16245 [Vibrio vulnificus]|uniref:Uncharacterized protein n=1 Tax=Vibrio vulnificus TaxID=672 RepID=A0A8H9N1Y5_VIBVL|nr:hypothetical protein [Vibrio vulnificus]HAS8541335.1 hypothetical protein [Vibrio vulnificus]
MNNSKLVMNQDIVNLIKANPTCDKVVFITTDKQEFFPTKIDSDIKYYVEIVVNKEGNPLSSSELLSELEKDISERNDCMYLTVWVKEHDSRHLLVSSEIEGNTIKVFLDVC